jgi:hypothetical protein
VYTGQCPVHHRTVSGAPEDSDSNLPPSGISRGTRAIIHRTVRCSKERWPPELASLGYSLQLLRYNSPDSPVCTGLSGVPAGQRLFRRQRLPATHLMHALRAQKSGVPILAHRTLNSTCPVRHRTSRRSQKSELQRSESNGIGDVARAPDMSGVHRTVRCAIDRQPPPMVKFGGWGYKYPNHPTIHCIQVSHFSTTYKS